MGNQSTKLIIDNIEYSIDPNEYVYLVPLARLSNFRVGDLPNNSSLHISDINLQDLDIWVTVTNANSPGMTGAYSIFIYISTQTKNYQDGGKRIYNVIHTISKIASDGYLDTPQVGAAKLADNHWNHYVTYTFDDKSAEVIFIKELGEKLYYALSNLEPSIQVFLCHSSEDKQIVEQFANKLRNSNNYVWFDKWEIKVGDSIIEKINEGLNLMTHLVIFLSESSVKKPWVKKELSTALMKKLSDNSVKIMPVKLGNVEIPAIINDIKYADCSDNLESGFSQIIDDLKNENNKLLE